MRLLNNTASHNTALRPGMHSTSPIRLAARTASDSIPLDVVTAHATPILVFTVQDLRQDIVSKASLAITQPQQQLSSLCFGL